MKVEEKTMKEQKDLVEEVENFAIIFILVCIATAFVRLLCTPFKGTGCKGWALGLLAVPQLCFSIFLDVATYVYAKEVTKIDTATVTVPVANIRNAPSLDAEVIERAQQGTIFQRVKTSASDNNWVTIITPTDKQYMHKSVLMIKTKKMQDRAYQVDYILGMSTILYILCAWIGLRRQKRQREARLEYLGLSDRQLS